jgi:MOSC domain-containing protein YiiM
MNHMNAPLPSRGVSGRVIGLARRAESRAPMENLKVAVLTPEVGLLGDCKGRKFPERHVTILAREDWADAMLALAGPAGPPDLHWTTRRSNVLVEGVRLPRGIGSLIRLGDCMVQVTDQTTPCAVMENAYPGLLRALAQEWRGGVTCKVLAGGGVVIGDVMSIIHETAGKQKVHLPG